MEPAGLALTFDVLSRTDNEAAGSVLLAALDSWHASLQEHALAAILKRAHPAGHREVLARLHQVPDSWRPILQRYHSRLLPVCRQALLGGGAQLCANACLAAQWFRVYDLVPTLLLALEEANHPQADLIAQTLMELVNLLCAELGSLRPLQGGDSPALVRRRLISVLETAVGRYGRHQRREVLEAFAALVHRDNLTLKQVLDNPHHAAFIPLVDLLARSPQRSILRLVLGFLDDPQAPSTALSVIARRNDPEFVAALLRKIGREPSAVVAQNLRRMGSIAWARNSALLEKLGDAEQHAAVRLLMASAAPRRAVFGCIEWMLTHGKPAGRRAAAEALARFHGAEANRLALRALADKDPDVQAKVIVQLRSRGIPGALNRILALVDSPSPAVRAAVRKSLPEFHFDRFLADFDMLDDATRRSTGSLVRKVDPRCLSRLWEEMRSRVRRRRLRALAVARALQLESKVEESILRLLHDEDHMIRAEAAATLAACRTPAARLGLTEALEDRSPVVQEAARKALEAQGIEAEPSAPPVARRAAEAPP